LVLEVGSGSAAETTATFADLVGMWLLTIAVRLSPKTVYDYERILDRWAAEPVGDGLGEIRTSARPPTVRRTAGRARSPAAECTRPAA
jgi:hypothetical protein